VNHVLEYVLVLFYGGKEGKCIMIGNLVLSTC